eukprot:TRINITY_DN8755_c0_g1_i2.p1 TRINITY_DN8755_c0_g1~~TRINITY_DN8755_c0_g1_i2.p1  ORF type:complete len:301 (-),score=44.17 TRINITY_DN8755_c0_g1_i2:40-942(-)
METQDPFLFAVYHKDEYPAGNERMEAPRRGNGSDFNPNAPWRMYHGDKVPGFPKHPHRGFETITCTLQGIIDHTDSLGCSGRYGNGDLQWMTAGKGIVHGENFPLLNMDSGNTCRFFQLWINLPAASKMAPSTQVMHWAESVPHFQTKDGKVSVTVWAGKFEGEEQSEAKTALSALPPPPNSWAADPEHDVAIFFIRLAAAASVRLPQTKKGTNRSLFFIKGNGNLSINQNQTLGTDSFATLRDAVDVEVKNEGSEEAEILILQGQPINEPVAQYGPFVMNTNSEIKQAFEDYRLSLIHI